MMKLLNKKTIIISIEIVCLLGLSFLFFFTRSSQLGDYDYFIGGDAYTHAAISKYITENKSLPDNKPVFYPESNLTYPPLYQITTALISLTTGINLDLIYRYFGPILSIVSLLVIYFLLISITKNKYAVFIILFSLVFFPILKEMQSVSIPDNMNYIFMPLSILLSYKYISTKENRYLLISIALLIVGLLFHIGSILILIPIVLSYFITRGAKKRNFVYITCIIILILIISFFVYRDFLTSVLPSLFTTLTGNLDNAGELLKNFNNNNLLLLISARIYYLYIFLLIFGFLYILRKKKELYFFIYIALSLIIFLLLLFTLNVSSDLIIRTLSYLIIFTLPLILYGIINILGIINSNLLKVLLVIIMILSVFSLSESGWDTRMTDSEHETFIHFNQVAHGDLLIVPPMFSYHAQYYVEEPNNVYKNNNECKFLNNTEYDIVDNLKNLDEEYHGDIYLFVPFEKLNTWWVKHKVWGKRVCAGTDIDLLKNNNNLELVYSDELTYLFKLIPYK